MIDLEAHHGRSGRVISYDDLMTIMAKDKIVVEPGDFVLFRTGFAEMLLEMNNSPTGRNCSPPPARWTAGTRGYCNGSPTAARSL